MIEVITFDLGNVILPFDFMRCFLKLERFSPYSSQQIYQSMLDADFVWDYEQGKISSRKFFSLLKNMLCLELDFERFVPLWGDIFTEDKQVAELIRNLSNRYRLFLLSNTNELHFEFIRRHYPIVEDFQEQILSYRLGYAKPDAPIWEEAIQRAGVAASKIIYIDDREDFAQAASRAGMIGIAFTSCSRLIQELIKYGVTLENA